MENTPAQPLAQPLPTLPSAKPPKSIAALFLGLSGIGLFVGLGLGSSAVLVYMQNAQTRLSQNDALDQLDRDAEIRQRRAQLERGYSAPVWVAGATYSPGVTYEIDGVREIEVPVLLGTQLDTAVCIGTMGPTGFRQNVDSPLCVGY